MTSGFGFVVTDGYFFADNCLVEAGVAGLVEAASLAEASLSKAEAYDSFGEEDENCFAFYDRI